MPRQFPQQMRRRNKYGAKPTHVDGIRFDSTKEAKRWSALKLLERAGEISELEPHPVFRLYAHNPDGPPVGGRKYTADFRYREGGHVVVEDVKSPATRRTEAYRLRLWLFQANHPDVVFREV